MRIVDGKVIVCCPGRNFVTLKLVTEDGVYGLGDATLNGRELAVMLPLVAAIVWLGVYPAPVLRRMEPAARNFVLMVEARASQTSAFVGGGR